jgi:hypothetical protein
VGYLEDGTMVVVEEGRTLIGSRQPVVVTGALQTPTGRMVFARRDKNGHKTNRSSKNGKSKAARTDSADEHPSA